MALPENGSIHYSLVTRNSISDAKTQVAERNPNSQNDPQTSDGLKSLDTVSVVPDLHPTETEFS